MMRQLIEGFISNKLIHHKYNIRGRKPKYCNNIEKKYQNLIICIYKKITKELLTIFINY